MRLATAASTARVDSGALACGSSERPRARSSPTKSTAYQKKSRESVTVGSSSPPPTTTFSPSKRNARAAASRSSSSVASRNILTGGHDRAPQFRAKWMRLSNGPRSSSSSPESTNFALRGSSAVKPLASRDLRRMPCSMSSSESVSPATRYTAPVAPEKKAARSAGEASACGAPSTTVACMTMALYTLMYCASVSAAIDGSSARRAVWCAKARIAGDVRSAA
mmetsp:Transcript_3366/g.12963  ORF Transcript_3366/g.12963 Transcript_3366/m.12963 type:complete len:222 (+) Transcript_3366:640-1305(+)